MDYVEADEQFFELLEDQGTPMFQTVRTTAFPRTYEALFGFCARVNVLKTAMFDMIESENPYAFKALFRCFSEHYLKFTYVWVRFLVEKTDAPGTDYFLFCGAREARQYAAALVAAEKLIGNDVVADVNAFVAHLYPAAAQLSADELRRQSGQFEYRQILDFLSKHPAVLGPKNPALARIVPKYASLSSFIHGGPASHKEAATFGDEGALIKCREDAGLVFMMAASVVMFTAMVVGREHPEHLAFAGKVHAVIRAFGGTDAPNDKSFGTGDTNEVDE